MMKGVCSALLLALAVVAVAGEPYNPARSLEAFYYTKAVVCDTPNLLNWNCTPCKYNPGVVGVRLFSNDTDGSLAFTGYDPNRKNVIVTVRGSKNIENFIRDLSFELVNYSYCPSCRVHKGFNLIYQDLVAVGLLRSVQSQALMHPDAQILLAGHSMGGSVLILLAMELARDARFRSRIQLYTYGQPRLGNKALAEYVATMLPGATHRITHKADPVPHLPPMSWGYLHAPQEIWYNNDGNTSFTQCDDSSAKEDEKCSDSIPVPITFADHHSYLGTCSVCECPPHTALIDEVKHAEEVALHKVESLERSVQQAAQGVPDRLKRFWNSVNRGR